MPVQIEYSPFLKQVVLDPIAPSLGAGLAAGAAGFLTGGVYGQLFSAHPVLFATVAGAQCCALGTTFYYGRSALIAGLVNGRPTQGQELKYSTLAGAASGAFTGALRSRSNIVPGALMMGILGFAGQKSFHAIPAIYNPDAERKPLVQRIMESRWVPLKSLSDDDYEAMLTEKLIRTEAEIALIDEKLAALRPVSSASEAQALEAASS